ncbi:SRPBCC family protein [Glycomyces terrestris]|uniref:SRPBCC family protein n=1 Tax=Glycomyces terrestris TaxID=2493553 RepID=A0A426UYU6_9ACTN|nr:SRPBCC family protein [Glycomyces terrestris]RRR99757.1 SRPBCC family protein [Glycomyces terrestris]
MPDPQNPIEAAGLVAREIRSGERGGAATKVLVARRRYRADQADVWDALTSAERLPRWFLPVAGDLEVGGRYQFDGNAGGLVERCDAPDSLAVTWEFGGQVSWLEVNLSKAEGGTVLELVHEAPVDPEMWRQYGPGAVGIGWDGSLYGLGVYLETGTPLDGAEFEAWMTGPGGIEFARATGGDWAKAAVAAGDDPAAADAALEAVVAFYTVAPPEEPEA